MSNRQKEFPLNEDLLQSEQQDLPIDVIKKACLTRFPSPVKSSASSLTNEEKKSLIADKFRDIMEILDLDLTDHSLKHTPERVAKMYVEEIFSGLNPNNFPEISFIEDRFKHGQQANMVLVKVNFCSFCEHHFVPMHGTASVAYLPNGKLIGVSKIPRIVKFFAKRPQVQERLTAQIADALSILTGSDDVAASLCAAHQCMIARGIESENSYVVTNVLRGKFETDLTLNKNFLDHLSKEM